MHLGRLTRLLAALAGLAAVVAVLFGLLLAINAEWGFAGCTGTSAFGWLLPLVAGTLIGGVSWFLLFTGRRFGSGESLLRAVPCPSCDKTVMVGWRLCPYCGHVLPLEQASGAE